MAILTIRSGPLVRQVAFDPPHTISPLLREADMSTAQPCGGRGSCGKCAVVLTGDVSEPTASEKRFGVRLSCQAVLHGDAEVILPATLPMAQIEGGAATNLMPAAPMPGHYGAAVDIGTTTIALLLYDLSTGRCMASASMLNPQTSVAADVIGRIDASMKGLSAHLRSQTESAVSTLLTTACGQAGLQTSAVDALTITGNTTMLYLLCGLEPSALSRAPFTADHLFGCSVKVLDRTAYLPHCLHAFVGADTSCAILANGMLTREETALLCDVGTNGEIALWHKGTLYIASTAAGPAFEGAGISCGCASLPGAIDRAEVLHGEVICHTIGGGKAVGLCGSGLVDVIAALLQTDALDETGCLEDSPFHLRDGISLTQADIRAVQLAKAAIHAGILSLLDAAGCSLADVSTMYLAGGFGSHLNLSSAATIGLFPSALTSRVRVIGNAALDGAALLLLDTAHRETLALLQKQAQHVRLDGNPVFAENYISAMLFGQE